MAMILAYWDIRGLAHAIRLLLEYTETPYEDKLYSCGEVPDYDKSQWISEKEKLGLDFPNLPYLIDGKTKLTCLDQFKNLQDFLTHFEALEKIAAYMHSSRFMKTPINNKMAKWGNKKE
ncbi:UNVERIFIED_CONTAM: hypothetical protein K2H54_015476 [Gekko kuhli]